MSTLTINIAEQNREIINNVNEFVQGCVDSGGNIDPIIENLTMLKGLTEKTGISLAWMLYKTKRLWHQFDVGDNFEDTMVARTGLNPTTVKRYIRVAELIDNCPPDHQDALIDKGIGKLIPAANALSQGYDFKDETWAELAETDKDDLADYVSQNIKGGSGTRSNGLKITMDRDGSLWAFDGQDNRHFIGSLEVGVAESEPVVDKAINRIVSNSNIVRR